MANHVNRTGGQLERKADAVLPVAIAPGKPTSLFGREVSNRWSIGRPLGSTDSPQASEKGKGNAKPFRTGIRPNFVILGKKPWHDRRRITEEEFGRELLNHRNDDVDYHEGFFAPISPTEPIEESQGDYDYSHHAKGDDNDCKEPSQLNKKNYAEAS